MSASRHVSLFSLLSLLTADSEADIVLEPELFALLDKQMREKQSFLLTSETVPTCKMMHNGVRILCAELEAK